MKGVQIVFAVSCAMVLGFVAGNYRGMHESNHRISQVKHARDVNLVVQEDAVAVLYPQRDEPWFNRYSKLTVLKAN